MQLSQVLVEIRGVDSSLLLLDLHEVILGSFIILKFLYRKILVIFLDLNRISKEVDILYL